MKPILSPGSLAIASLFAGALQTMAVTQAADEVPGVTMEPTSGSVQEVETPAQRDARMAWWREAKFGLFIHWGIYAVPAGKYGDNSHYGEWIMNSAKIPVATYQEFARQFNPGKYDPATWARLAKDAGMKYIVITSKHHDGFALFPSEASKWNVRDATPYKKDLLAPLVTAAKSEGLKIGFYYSQSQDWNNPGGAKSGSPEGGGWDEAHKGSYDSYLKDVAVPQVRELLTRYPIDILWWDTPMFMDRKRAEPFAALTSLRPGLMMNNRLGGGFNGDTATPEQFVPVTGYKGDWETCMTMNDHWGYNAVDKNWKSSADLIRKLADICAKGGNFLLNIGPTAEGEFPPACIDRLKDIGRWLKTNGDSIYGTTAGPFPYLSWGVATRKSDRLYLHVFEWPKDGKLRVPLDNTPKAAALLGSPEQKLTITKDNDCLVIDVPVTAPDAVDTVITLEIEGTPVVRPLPTAGATATASGSAAGSQAANALDGSGEKRWRAPIEEKSAWLELNLTAPAPISAFGLDEPDVWPRMNQKFTLEAFTGGQWIKVAEGKTNGHGLKKSIAPVTAQKFRLTMECDKGSPGVAELQLYRGE
jgi:alpha-L-fucosidase